MGVFLVAAISTTIVKELIAHITHGVAEAHSFHREHSMASFVDDQRHGARLVVGRSDPKRLE